MHPPPHRTRCRRAALVVGGWVAVAALPGPAGPPVRVLFDTDMGSDCDDAGALALLHRYADEGQAEIVACVYSSGRVPYGAAVIEAINRYYGRPDIPIGAYHRTDLGDPVDKMRAETLARDAAARGNRIVHNHDAPELTGFLRGVLAAPADRPLTYVTVGHTRGLDDLLRSGPDEHSPLTGHDLVIRTVARWVALGALHADNPDGHYARDWNFSFNDTAPATARLVRDWPVPAVFVSAGDDVYTGQSLARTPLENPVRVAYTEWLDHVSGQTLADQRPSWDLAAVYYAVEGEGDFLQPAEPGRLAFDVTRGARWIPGPPEDPHRFVRLRPGVEASFAAYLNHCLAQPPGGERRGRD